MIGYGASGVIHDFYCYNAANQVWNGAAFVSWSDADYASYRITATQAGTSGRFTGTAPADTAYYELRERGASLALSYVVWAELTTGESIDWTADERAAIRAILGIPATGTTPETPTSGVLASIKTKTDLITPGQVYAITRITRTGSIVDVEQFEHETTLPEPFDTTIDYSATTLECVWERESDNTEIAKIDNAAFTKTASTIAINEIPVAVRSTVRTLKYSIRAVTGERVIQTGNWIVSRAPRDRS